MVKFKYYRDDPIDDVPAPAWKMILSFAGITAIFVGYIFFWGALLSP